MSTDPPKIVRTPSGLRILALQQERFTRHYPQDKGKHEFRTLVPGVFVEELDDLSYRAEHIDELSLGPRGLGRKKILARYVEKPEKMEVTRVLKESGYKGRFYFWK